MREEEAFIAFTAILGLFAFAWVAIRHCAWVTKAWIETGLKRDMVARGYTAQEIVAVVGADRGCRTKVQWADVPPAKPIRQPVYQ